MRPAVLVLVVVLVLAGCAPSRQERERRAREERLQQRLAVCDQRPTFGDRFECWSATIKEHGNAVG
jgi:hypothetical protein